MNIANKKIIITFHNFIVGFSSFITVIIMFVSGAGR